MIPRPPISRFVLSASCLIVALILFAGESHSQDAPSTAEPTAEGHPKHPANHLAGETSPYLLLHVHNPVDWHPWGPDAFAKAKRENKPIFLSIGYSSCFWCHVMERESFSDEEIAAYLNEHFVSVKVDREERPDVDDVYMTALQVYQQLAGSAPGGGWPLSMFLTPDGKPILGGTYFPPRAAKGMPGFLSVIKQVDTIWTERQKDLQDHAELITREVRRVMQPTAETATVDLDRSLVDRAVAAVRSQYDAEYGGLDFNADRPIGPKFPVPSRLMLLQARTGRPTDAAENPSPQEMVDVTLDRMRRGGIHDHLGGGFHRYSTDRKWLVPHFEKMLYDNAQLSEVYADAYRRTNRRSYRDVAEATYAFVLRELTDSGGAFYSALDAETDGVEGQFYVWDPAEIEKLLGTEDAELFQRAYGLKRPEFFEHGYVLHLPQPLTELAEELGLPQAELRERLSASRDRLLEVRTKRPALLRDDKVLTSWNGLMIRSLANGGDALQRPDLIQAAERGALFLLAELRDDEGRLLRTHRADQSKLNAYLDDYAFLVDGLLALHRVTQADQWLSAARRLTDDQLDLFWDDKQHGFFFTSDHHEELLARTKNAYDSVIPSGNAVSVRNLTRLALLTGDLSYRERARQTLQVFASKLQEQPASMTFMALALDEYLDAFDREGLQVTAAKLPAAEEAELAQFTVKPPASAASDDEPLILAGRTNPRDREAKVSAKAYLSLDKLPAGGTADVAVVLTLQEGWHINPNPATLDFQIPSEMTIKAKQKSVLQTVTYPKGKMIDFVGERVAAYEGTATLTGKLKVPAAAAGQTEEIALSVYYQACSDQGQCLRPTTAELTIRVPVAGAGEAPKPINRRLFEKPKEKSTR